MLMNSGDSEVVDYWDKTSRAWSLYTRDQLAIIMPFTVEVSLSSFLSCSTYASDRGPFEAVQIASNIADVLVDQGLLNRTDLCIAIQTKKRLREYLFPFAVFPYFGPTS